MIIEDLRSERQNDRARIAATVRWEDSNRPTQEVYFETQAAFADYLTLSPHAFLIGCLIPAFHHREERIVIKEEICPELREGVLTVMEQLRHWYCQPGRSLVRIEAGTLSRSQFGDKQDGAAAFFSGGVDSWATLRRNRLNFPLEHPGCIKYGLVVFGLFLEEHDNFRSVLNITIDAARQAGVIPIPVWTNIISLGNGWEFWEDKGEGAVLSAIAHAFAKRISVVYIASNCDIPRIDPHGSHPMLDPYYSSDDLRINHDGICLSRLMKVRLVVDWDVALQNLRSCNQTGSVGPEKLNCGHCEKCVRTMLALLSVGAINRTRAFPIQDISAGLVKSAVCITRGTFPFYGELLPPLAALGRHDLVMVIEKKLSRYRRTVKKEHLKSRIKRFDAQYLQGTIAESIQLIRAPKVSTSNS